MALILTEIHFEVKYVHYGRYITHKLYIVVLHFDVVEMFDELLLIFSWTHRLKYLFFKADDRSYKQKGHSIPSFSLALNTEELEL